MTDRNADYEVALGEMWAWVDVATAINTGLDLRPGIPWASGKFREAYNAKLTKIKGYLHRMAALAENRAETAKQYTAPAESKPLTAQEVANRRGTQNGTT